MSVNKGGVKWSLTGYFPSFNGPEMSAFNKKLSADLLGLQKKSAMLGALSATTAGEWEELVLAAETCTARLTHIACYLGCLEVTHGDKGEYRQKVKFTGGFHGYDKIEAQLLWAFRNAGDGFFEKFIGRRRLAPVAYYLRGMRERGKHVISQIKEKRAAKAEVNAVDYAGRAYGTLAKEVKFEMVWPEGCKEKLPISRWRALTADADRNVARAAFRGGSSAWGSIADGCAVLLNHIAGARLARDERPGAQGFLRRPLQDAGISRKTFDALYKAIGDNFDAAREVMRVKARSKGLKSIYFFERGGLFDLKDKVLYNWEEASQKVSAAFSSTYPALGQYYRQFLANRWLESKARPGQRKAAYCMGSAVSNEERVYLVFKGTSDNVLTLAHELGHAWHRSLLRGMRPWARQCPKPLNETAALFAARIVVEGILTDKNISDERKLALLDADMNGAAVLLLEVTMQYEFVKAFYGERVKGEVSAARLKVLMTRAQRRVFGSVIEPGGESPMLWASGEHFYKGDAPFNDFPYTFGFLLAAALHARFKVEGQAFLPKYEAFLRQAGSVSVEEVALRSFGFYLGDPAFWSDTLAGLNVSVAEYTKLLCKGRS